jgi:hypothetical protein
MDLTGCLKEIASMIGNIFVTWKQEAWSAIGH